MYFLFSPDRIMEQIIILRHVSKKLSGYLNDLYDVGGLDGSSYRTVLDRLKIYKQNLEAVCNKATAMENGLSDVRDLYFRTESTLLGRPDAIDWKKIIAYGKDDLEGLLRWFRGGFESGGGYEGEPRGLIDYIGNFLGWDFDDSTGDKLSRSLWGINAGTGGGFLGMDWSATGAAHLMHLTEEGFAGAELDWDNGRVFAGVREKLGFSVFDAEGGASVGWLQGNGRIGLGNVGLQGEAGINIFQDGSFKPSIGAGIKGEASALNGDLNGQFGSDQYNIHGRAEGKLLGAEAEGRIWFGEIEDDDGTVKYGFDSKLQAEYYAAQGTVGTGFTLFGIKVDGSITGKLGGAGIGAGVGFSTGGVEGEASLGFLAGLGFKVSVDWSGFEMPDFDLTDIEWPDLSDWELPDLEWPTIDWADIDISDWSWPWE